MRRRNRKFGCLFLGVIFMVLYCEFLIYYVAIAQCFWPAVNNTDSESVLKAFMLTDIHMFGDRNGHKIDKLRREWQMHRAFQTILTWHNPDVVFVLGDSFDEGEWSTQQQFDEYVHRFFRLFYVPKHIKMFVVAGNHDVGFHYNIKPDNLERFYDNMNTSSVQMITLKNNHFVLINSMAMEGDNCSLCKNARDSIEKISDNLNCSRYRTLICYDSHSKIVYSRPILLQHFPLYRKSDAVCAREMDAVPWYEKDIPFRTKIDDISEEATDYLATKLRPRVVFGGHTHYSCLVRHMHEDVEFLEYSIPSFSWRNILWPKYFLVTITPEEYAVNKCGLPAELTIVITAVIILCITMYIVRRKI